MRYKRSFMDILNLMISRMTFTGSVYKAVLQVGYDAPGNTYLVNVDRVQHFVPGNEIAFGSGKLYTFISADDTQDPMQMLVNDPTGTMPAPVYQDSFTAPTPHFYFGTPKDTATENAQQTDSKLKYPMIWLWHDGLNFKERFHDDPQDSKERLSTCRLFFLVDNNPGLNIESNYDAYIRPMRRLLYHFVNEYNKSYDLFERWEEDYDVKDWNHFNVYIASSRNNDQDEGDLFADNLCGCELDITFKVLKTNSDCPDA